MAGRPKVCLVHKVPKKSCVNCEFTKRKQAKAARSRYLASKVDQEVEFLKSLPDEDEAIRKIEEDQKTEWAIERASKRFYTGPPLLTKKAIKAEKIRQKKLDIQFKKEAAEWTVIRKMAKKAYNPEREAILEDMKLDLIEMTMENDKVKVATAQKLAENSELQAQNERLSSNLITNYQQTRRKLEVWPWQNRYHKLKLSIIQPANLTDVHLWINQI